MVSTRVISGVYSITFEGSSSRYIGSSRDIAKRTKAHIDSLESRSHSNYKLQKAWRRYGVEKMKVHVLLECSIRQLKQKEQIEIDRCRKFKIKLFNILLKTEGALSIPARMRKSTTKKKSKPKTRTKNDPLH